MWSKGIEWCSQTGLLNVLPRESNRATTRALKQRCINAAAYGLTEEGKLAQDDHFLLQDGAHFDQMQKDQSHTRRKPPFEGEGQNRSTHWCS